MKMKRIFLLMIVLLMTCFPAHARYKCHVNSPTNEVIFYATKMKDNFSKADIIEFGKCVKRDNSANYYLIAGFLGKHLGTFFLSDEAKIFIDGSPYTISKDLTAGHLSSKYRPDKSSLYAEYFVSEEVAEKIKTSKGNITFLFVIENRDEKMVDFGIKTADEIRFVANRSFEDYAAVSKNKLKPTYTEENK